MRRKTAEPGNALLDRHRPGGIAWPSGPRLTGRWPVFAALTQAKQGVGRESEAPAAVRTCPLQRALQPIRMAPWT